MPFTPVQREKCEACGKSVYATERTVLEGTGSSRVFHKTCIRCSTCNKALSVGDVISHENVFYCKTHFNQKFKTKGNYDLQGKSISSSHAVCDSPKSFIPSSGDDTAPKQKHETSAATREKFKNIGGSERCKICSKAVYEAERLIVENRGERVCYHKNCFVCQYEGCSVKLDLRNYGSHADKVYCKTHLKEASINYVAKPNENSTPREVSEKFKNLGSGGDKCAICNKGVYQLEKLTVEGTGTDKVMHYHKSCFKCSVCNQQLDLSTYGSNNGVIYCFTHLKTHGKVQQARQEVFISPLAANNPNSGIAQQRDREEEPTREDDEENTHGALPPQSQEEPEPVATPQASEPEPEPQASEPEPEPQALQSEPEPEPESTPAPQQSQDDDEDEEIRERRRKREERERKRREEEEEEERQLEQKRREREERRRRLEEE